MRSPGKASGARPGATKCCAIYTRKSSEEGLEQAFNSLDAQREACEAYIRSQRHEGWVLVPTFYDDGGISGGTLERPALRQLLADIRTRKVDLVVVYKVDRLTRSLADFAKIVDVFDAHQASFVSVTQQFNTTTSMGRLTLNMLLSFAQFEREVTGERIRDKVAASKRKGMWMGGTVPLGYDVQDRKLVVNEAEAETVQHIYRRYLELGSVRVLQEQLASEGIRSKLRPAAMAKMRGGRRLERGALYLILQNRLYRGEVHHQGKSYPGEHPAIIDAELWEAVQQHLAANRAAQSSGRRAQNPSLLAGLVQDEAGGRLVPTHAVKGDRRYRYYVSKPAASDEQEVDRTAIRVPAGDLDRVVADRVRELLADRGDVFQLISRATTDGLEQRRLLDAAANLAGAWTEQPVSSRRAILQRLLAKVVVQPEQVELHLHPGQLTQLLAGKPDGSPVEIDPPPIIIAVPITLKRAGLEMRLVIDGAGFGPEPDRTLIRLIARAQAMRDRMLAEAIGINELAQREGVTSSYASRIVRLGFLAPDLVAAILEGRQPLGLTANKLMQDSRLPVTWTEQRVALGFH
ncbi:recombinase family protein [Humitalea sp. 24SJ18S-53]|uniref:recombinase family protein n=1 Tax=Humitalea sp. 24SJ18S-53 TaxID=3422307 RepID=UPI003D66CE04